MVTSDDVDVLEDLRRDLGDRVVKIRILDVPVSEQFPEGVKYALHYGRKHDDDPILRYDNHHGVHERHDGETVEVIDFPGVEALVRRFTRELPSDLREDHD